MFISLLPPNEAILCSHNINALILSLPPKEAILCSHNKFLDPTTATNGQPYLAVAANGYILGR